MMIFVQTAGDPLAQAPSVRVALRRFAPRDPIYEFKTMSARIATASAQARLSAVLLALFATMALTLAVMGIYGSGDVRRYGRRGSHSGTCGVSGSRAAGGTHESGGGTPPRLTSRATAGAFSPERAIPRPRPSSVDLVS